MKKTLSLILAAILITATIPVSASAVTTVVSTTKSPVDLKPDDSVLYDMKGRNGKYTVISKTDWIEEAFEPLMGRDIYKRKLGTTEWLRQRDNSYPELGETWEYYCVKDGVKSNVIQVTYKQYVYVWDNMETTALSKAFTYKLDDMTGIKAYYTTNGKKPTTKSKRLTAKGVKLTKSCTFQVLVTKPGYENTYFSYEVDVNKSNAYTKKAGLNNLANVYRPKEFGIGRKYGYTGKLYYTTDGSKPTTNSTEAVHKIGYGDRLDKTTTVNFLYITSKGKKYYFSQTYVLDDNAYNARTGSLNGLGG